MTRKYYTVDQVAKMLNMHPKTIQRYIREGKLKANKVGKSWRINGHDLSLFVEGRKNSISNKQNDKDKVKVSSVIDIEVSDMEEGMRIVNMLTAALNTKPPEYGRSTMSSLFLESELKVRVMLWGSIKFMDIMLSSISALIDENQEDNNDK